MCASPKELHELRCARAMASALSGPGAPLVLPSGATLRICSAPGVEVGSVVWEGSGALLAHLFALPPAALRGARVLELGCGVGPVGIACAALGAESVLLTDHKEALLLLAERNIAANAGVAGVAGRATTRLLEWGSAGWAAFAGAPAAGPAATLVVGADLVYTEAGARLLAETLAAALAAGGGGARALLAYKERGQGPLFFAELGARGLAHEAVFAEGAHTVFSITKRR
jgi:hypothetical protein